MERVVVTSFGLEQDVKLHMRIPPQVLTIGFLSLSIGLRPPCGQSPWPQQLVLCVRQTGTPSGALGSLLRKHC